MPHHARASGWTEVGDRKWWHRCDQCGQRRLVDTYFEVYPPLGSKGKESGWWYACTSCMVDIASTQFEEARAVLRQYERWVAALVSDDEAWGTGLTARSTPTLTQDLLDRLLEIQGPRDEVISRKLNDGSITINRARQLHGLPTHGPVADETAQMVLGLPGAAAIVPMPVTAGGFDEVFGPCILDENGEPLVAVDHLAVDAIGIRDRLLEALR